MALSIKLTKITPLYPHGFFVQWALGGATASGVYRFDVFRSGSSEGPWELVVRQLANQYAYTDRLVQPEGTAHADYRRPNQLGFTRGFFYRVVVTGPDGAQAEVVDDLDPQLDRKQAQYWRKMVRDLSVGLRKLNGVPCAVLKKKQWGERCPRCYDKVSREVVRANCVTCWGTGFVGGYWAPVKVHTRRSAPVSATQQTPEGKSDSNSVRIWMPHIPQLDRDDVIVFLRDNKRFRVDQQSETQITTVTVHQTISAVEIERSHILYKLPVDVDAVQPLI